MEYHILLRMHAEPEIFFQMLADTTRLRVAMLLQHHGELCVCELTHALALSQPKISRHLGQMREAGLVQTRRAGRWMYYRLHPDLQAWMQTSLASTLDGVAELSPYKEDAQLLAGMPNRPGASSCCA
ncbi:MAG: metalloregulator ArsR/SmtB family transcription factor [Gammaproteobacteria bacterium]|nr:MAG: metalloregulator ArsR/SmtB family transcription factor [Gammaproteobacteria bacterium]